MNWWEMPWSCAARTSEHTDLRGEPIGEKEALAHA